MQRVTSSVKKINRALQRREVSNTKEQSSFLDHPVRVFTASGFVSALIISSPLLFEGWLSVIRKPKEDVSKSPPDIQESIELTSPPTELLPKEEKTETHLQREKEEIPSTPLNQYTGSHLQEM